MKKLAHILLLSLTSLSLLVAAPVVQPQLVHAASIINPGSADEACKGVTGNASSTAADCKDSGFFSDLVTNVVSVLTFVVGGVAVIMLVIGGIRYAISGGDANAVASAKNTILYAIVGIVVAASAYLIVRFVISRL